MESLNLKKIFLYLLIGSVAVSALLGIGVILFGNFGDTEAKILLTTLTVTITSILGLACGAFYETGRGRGLPVAGILLAVAAAVLWIIFTWGHFESERFFIKVAFTATLLAAGCSHISLLSIARLEQRFRWSLYAAHFAVWTLTAILLYIIWMEPSSDSDFVTRLIGVLSIVIAAMTIITPVFHWLSQHTPPAEEIDAEIARLRARIEELEKQRAELQDDAD
jgi:hypothetical protein